MPARSPYFSLASSLCLRPVRAPSTFCTVEGLLLSVTHHFSPTHTFKHAYTDTQVRTETESDEREGGREMRVRGREQPLAWGWLIERLRHKCSGAERLSSTPLSSCCGMLPLVFIISSRSLSVSCSFLLRDGEHNSAVIHGGQVSVERRGFVLRAVCYKKKIWKGCTINTINLLWSWHN